MKNLFNITLLFLLAILSFSCRNANDIPQDIHEHEEIEKLIVTVTNKNSPGDKQTITYLGGVSDTQLHLLAGETYFVNLDFQVKHDDHYHSVNEEIIEEKDKHFITFDFAGSDISVLRSATDPSRTDGNKLGLETEWNVISAAANGKVNIKLVHLPATIEQNFPSAANQHGRTTGGETDVNALININ